MADGGTLAKSLQWIFFQCIRESNATPAKYTIQYGWQWYMTHIHGGGQAGRISNFPYVFYTSVVYWQKDIFAWLSVGNLCVCARNGSVNEARWEDTARPNIEGNGWALEDSRVVCFNISFLFNDSRFLSKSPRMENARKNHYRYVFLSYSALHAMRIHCALLLPSLYLLYVHVYKFC